MMSQKKKGKRTYEMEASPSLLTGVGCLWSEPTWERMWKHVAKIHRWREGGSADPWGHGPAWVRGFVWAFRVGGGGGGELRFWWQGFRAKCHFFCWSRELLAW